MALDSSALGLAGAALGASAKALVDAKSYTDSKVQGIAYGVTYKGAVNTVDDLPASGNTKGDQYNVKNNREGHNGEIGYYIWNGTGWDHSNERGERGDAATVNVGSTTTGEPGTQASVVNTGTQYDAVLEFTIPRGERGLNGDIVGVKYNGTAVPNSGGYALMTTDPVLANAETTGGIGWTEGTGAEAVKHMVSSDYLNTQNNVSSTSTTDPLSAYQGKLLNDRLNNVESLGRYLSIWECTTGLPVTNPTTLPYTYVTGDWYIIGHVAASGGTNYMPSGTTYTGAASTTVATETPTSGMYYLFDGTVWALKGGSGGGDVADVEVDGTSVVSGKVAQINSDNVVKKGLTNRGSSFSSSEKTAARTAIDAQQQMVFSADWDTLTTL